jgi:threonine aldolase
MKTIDLRSDTVTRPSAAMRQAMATAEVGDDVFKDDPTVAKLESTVAKLFDREAGLYVPSGTMSNQISFKVHSKRGDELLCERQCHVVNYECAGPVIHSGLLINLITTDRGMLTADVVRANIRPKNIHIPATRLVALENTHNHHGGTILPLDEIKKVREVCDEFGLVFHLDGARIWNAHIASGISLADLTRPFDSVSVCFSKGLGAPVGSMILGSREFIEKCRWERKIFGGGMRQVGIIAAGALYGVEHNIPRLAEDHANAKYLANALNELPQFTVDMSRVETNIVIAQLDSDATRDATIVRMKDVGVLAVPFGPKKIRFVTHLDAPRSDIEEAVDRVRGM